MKKTLIMTLMLMLILAGFSAQASLIGSITHDYGQNYSAPSLGSGTCDTLNTVSVTVRSGNNCQRFYDAFNFSHLDFMAIDKFELTLTYSLSGVGLTMWSARPAIDAVNGSAISPFLTRMSRGTEVSSTFVFTNTLDVFEQIVAGESFYLWFSRTLGPNSFELYSATLDVYGTPAQDSIPVPAPATLALLGLGLLGLRLRRR